MSTKLPFLPGYSIETKPQKNFHKTHIFDVKNNLRTQSDRKTVVDARASQKGNSLSSSLTLSSPPDDYKTENDAKFSPNNSSDIPMSRLPAFVAYDRKVLRFYAYFKESVHASPVENYRVRKCVVYYYLEDDSIHIAEPKIENSGIPQGVFVKRHRIPRDEGKNNNTYITHDNLAIGTELSIYGRVFRLVDADDFTRWFYEQNGKGLSSAEEYPTDPFTKKQGGNKPSHFHKTMHPFKLFMEANKGKPIFEIQATQKFLQNDGKVLRFYCTWDDDKLYGEKRPYIFHYFLADDTVEVLEIQQANSGRDSFPCLLKRSKLPKNHMASGPDVSRIGVQKHDEKIQYYTDADLKVGDTVLVFGRNLVLCGCDKFTQEYYVKTYSANPDDYHQLQVEEEVEAPPKMVPPPHNGIGTEEDSLGSFLYLMPKVPKQDFKKLMDNDGIVLRFLAKFVKPQIEDKDRRFIITYYPTNDSCSIFEKFERNSGFVGGKFLERSRIKNPDTKTYFKATDFYIGATIAMNQFQFEIVEGDECTLKYMKETYGMEQGKMASTQAQAKAAAHVQASIEADELVSTTSKLSLDQTGKEQRRKSKEEVKESH